MAEEQAYANDKVPERWKNLFTNDEWFMHDIVVKSTYGFLAIAIVAILCFAFPTMVKLTADQSVGYG